MGNIVDLEAAREAAERMRKARAELEKAEGSEAVKIRGKVRAAAEEALKLWHGKAPENLPVKEEELKKAA